MRRWFAASFLIIACTLAQARGVMLGVGSGGGGGLDPATIAWVNQVVMNGGTVSAGRQTTVNNLIVTLKNNGIWTIHDRIWLSAAENSISALTDIKGLVLASVVGSPVFTTNRGYAGTDLAVATDYINTGYAPSVNGVQLTQNAAHISAWVVTNTATVNGGAVAGTERTNGALGGLNIYDTFTDGNLYARVNDGTDSASQGVPATRTGHWLANRSGASASAAYQNGVLFSSPNAASGALSAFSVLVLADNNAANGPISGTPNQVAMVSLGGDLTSVASGVVNFYNALRTYMTAVGVP